MNLNDLANLGQIIGALTVVVSLIYIVLQIRQNTHAVRSAAAQSSAQLKNSRIRVRTHSSDRLNDIIAILIFQASTFNGQDPSFVVTMLVC